MYFPSKVKKHPLINIFLESGDRPSLNVNFYNLWPFFSRSKIKQDLSDEELIKSFLFGDMSTALIGAKWPWSSNNLFELLKSLVSNWYTLTIQSSPPVAKSVLSLENLQQFTDASSLLKSAWNYYNFSNFLN